MHVTQPALSQGIAQLERELGVPLFKRTPRGAVLTPAGKAAVEPARQALRGLSAVQSAALAVTGLAGGTLDIASLPTMAQSPVSELVARFRRLHPKVTVSIQSPAQTRVSEVAEMVRTGLCELGVTEGEPDLPEMKGFTTLSLGRQDYVAALPAAAQLNTEGEASWEEVLACGLIVGPWWESSRPAAYLDRTLGRRAWRKHVAVRIDHRDAYLPLVVSGAGAAILPRYSAHLAGAAGARVAELTPALWRSVVMIRTDDPLSPAAAAMWQLAEHPETQSDQAHSGA